MTDRSTPPRRVVLWGFMASGKTVVGARAAALLGWRHLDVDREIERAEGCTIAELFATRGEAHFRAVEVAVSLPLLALDRVVLSCGGGWVTNPGILDHVPPDSLTVWLRVSADTALRRVRDQRGGAIRPLLAGPDPAGSVRTLLAQREPLYARAEYIIDTDGRDPAAAAREIAARVGASTAGREPIRDENAFQGRE